MEQRPVAAWICLLGAGLTLASTSTTAKTELRAPRLIGCVFLYRANVTCRWEAGDTAATHYTLRVEKYRNGTPMIYNCTTTDTSCTALMVKSGVRFDFCISVTAHCGIGDITSAPRCQPGRIEVMLPPVPLISVAPVDGRPQCLNIIWETNLPSVFPVTASEIKNGDLNSQIEFRAQEQFDVQVSDVTVTNCSFVVCLFGPDTSYAVRLRHRYRGPQSPWSLWSNENHGRTGEDAPSVAPEFWRRVKPADESGRRLVSLLWKPLPRSVANGRVLFFNVTCQTESAQRLNSHGTCRDLGHTSTSCSLLLPAGRCSCALTASTSGGTSPEARIWFRRASETEPPPPSQIAVNPLSSSSLDVRWVAPIDPPASGFVLEWFAVREKNSSIVHWQRLNSSTESLVITEGVKPLERYVVSVRALYGERGAGQSQTVHNYTRQGVPSAGPRLEVHQISGSTVELIWAPVPVELLHGFIRSYTIHYTTGNQPAKNVTVPAHTHRYSLEDLPPGNYDVFMWANTDAGAGAAGPSSNVHIGSEEISLLMFAVLPLVLTSLMLVLIACLAQMVKQELHENIPDPFNSSLAHWTPKNTLEITKLPAVAEKPEIKLSEVILVGESGLQNSNSDRYVTNRSICSLQMDSSHSYSPLQVSETQTPQNGRRSETKCAKSSTRARTISNADLSSCPFIYSDIVFSQTLKSPPMPILSPSFVQSNGWQHSTASITGIQPQPGGDRERSAYMKGRSVTSTIRPNSPLFSTDELKNLRNFLRQQSPVSDFSSTSYSSVFLHPAEPTSPQCSLSQSPCNSVPSLKPNTEAFSDNLTTSLSPFTHSLFVDFSYCPVQCDPYNPPAV